MISGGIGFFNTFGVGLFKNEFNTINGQIKNRN